ncbi:enoyl-CoA hydratase/isomerase family protein [Devosia sp. MC532]|uniref:enoyl-CoA hydratase/isomerase family protein n=1 Tax=Devosia sp. MC532 TaxID=2799788 RepID=UPI0018F2FB02|nr:enoyl-CoA hydratase/isomerase family protein [Devosia sp. MC532]MBJ7577858.1 enoyl-CoA hydratase/isomerase family protein [Devosia sp. MC532]
MTYNFYTVAIAEFIATVTIARPPVNAQNGPMREELITIFETLGEMEEVRVIILTGAGKIFSAGADIKERVGITAGAGDYARNNRIVRNFFDVVSDCPKPVIAAVNGPMIGAGFVLALCADIMIASETASFQMPEVNVGLAGGTAFMTEHFGRSRARAMYLTGRTYPASELYRLGIAEAVVPNEQLLDEAIIYAREIASKSPLAIQAAKQGFINVKEMPVRDAYRYEQTLTVGLSKTDDAKEAQRAFVEKRQAKFVGR